MGCCWSNASPGELPEESGLLPGATQFRDGRASVHLRPKQVVALGVPELDRLFSRGAQIIREADNERGKVCDRLVLLMQTFNDDSAPADLGLGSEIDASALEGRLRLYVQTLRDAVAVQGAANLMAIVNENSPVMLSVFGLDSDLAPHIRGQLDAFEALGDALHDVTSRVRKRRQDLDDIIAQVEAKNVTQLVQASRLKSSERRRLPRKLAQNKTALRQFGSILQGHRIETADLAKVLETVARQAADSVTSN